MKLMKKKMQTRSDVAVPPSTQFRAQQCCSLCLLQLRVIRAFRSTLEDLEERRSVHSLHSLRSSRSPTGILHQQQSGAHLMVPLSLGATSHRLSGGVNGGTTGDIIYIDEEPKVPSNNNSRPFNDDLPKPVTETRI